MKKKAIKLDDRKNENLNIPPLNKEEKFAASLVWGGIPLNLEGVRENIIFQEKLKQVRDGIWKEYL